MFIPRQSQQSLLCVLFLFVSVGSPAFAECADPALVAEYPERFDSSFFRDDHQEPENQSNFAISYEGWTASSDEFHIKVKRAVGPGTGGFLQDYQTLVDNGVVSSLAWLEVAVGNTGEGAEGAYWSADLYLNDFRIATFHWGGLYDQRYFVNGVLSTPFTSCISFPSSFVKFAARNGAPADNELHLVVRDAGIVEDYPDFVAADPITLNIEAMAPIVLVHGINSGVDWFDHGFTGALDAAHFPWVAVEETNRGGLVARSIEVTGTSLQALIPSFAKQFGATKVHIVAHSKGGLWSRYFLSGPGSPYPQPGEELGEGDLGVLSLTTLDTPHYGSRVAYAGSALTNDALLRGLSVTSTTLAAVIRLVAGDSMSALYSQVFDLTPEAVGQFNRAYPRSPAGFRDADGTDKVTAYRMVAADADIGDKVNGFGLRFVDSTDVAGFSYPVLGPFLYAYLGDETEFLQVNPFDFPTSVFQQNDLVVTSNSARYLGTGPGSFVEILLNTEKNHTTVGDSSVAGSPLGSGTGVLGELRRIQPVH
jgi:hypothetical protein